MALYVSELLISRKQYQQKKIKSVYAQHVEIYKLFENIRLQQGRSANEHSGILWADKGYSTVARRFLILSNRPPKTDGEETITSKPLPDHFLDYKHYRFTVTVNPVLRDNRSGKLLPIKGRDNVTNWFCHQAETKWGFCVSRPHLLTDDIRVVQFKKPLKPNEKNKVNDKIHHDVTLQQATLSGYFTVTDSTCFQHSFSHGIGRGRSFGCGLLQIVPVIASPFN